MLWMKLKIKIASVVRPYAKYHFIKRLPRKVGKLLLLDVGCGNSSPFKTKLLNKDIFYTGLDVDDYNQLNNAEKYCDEYYLSTPDQFSETILNFNIKYDVVISCHNLEHVNDRDATLKSMLYTIKPGGLLYLSYPCKESIDFPYGRKGTLNYFDDYTHKDVPVDTDWVLNAIETNGFEVIYFNPRYSSLVLKIVGFLLEPFSAYFKVVLPGTWEYWGFETIIHAKKIR
jgi:SAM-dependent methyltransferase